MKVFGRSMRVRGSAAQQAEGKVYALIHQGISALPLIQSHAREHHERERFTAHTEEARQYKMAQQGLEVFYWGSISVILSACTLGVTWVGAQQVLASNLSVGELLVFLAYVAQLFEPLHQLSQVGATLSSARASTQRVFEILDTPEEVKDRSEARRVCLGRDLDGSAALPTSADNMFAAAGSAPAGLLRPPLPVYGNVSYDDVSFAYEDTRPVLRHVSFKLLAGTSVAIIGPSGAGKTTLLNLLPRFFDPASGAVLLEGVDLRDLRLEDLRAQIGLVLQEPIILPTTVAENISYGKPHATMEEIEAAAHAARADELIEKLPQHYRTVIGDGGARLSVGEKQRINLARAFLKDAPDLADGRADERARRGERSAGGGQPLRADARAYDVDGRPPAHHHSAGRQDPGGGRRPPDRDGRPRGPPRPAGLLRSGRRRPARSLSRHRTPRSRSAAPRSRCCRSRSRAACSRCQAARAFASASIRATLSSTADCGIHVVVVSAISIALPRLAVARSRFFCTVPSDSRSVLRSGHPLATRSRRRRDTRPAPG